jgi:hypothetical protein
MSQPDGDQRQPYEPPTLTPAGQAALVTRPHDWDPDRDRLGSWKDALAEVVRLRAENERLRGLLASLEWAGTYPDMTAEESAFCLVCMGWRHIGHNPGCELAAALGR